MNINIKRIIFAFLIILNCIAIFIFSAQNAEKSSQTSGVIVNKVVDTVSSVNKKVKKESLKNNVTFYVRKLAHFSIYTLLGIWLLNEMNTFKISTLKRIIVCLFFGAMYAISDEFHQSFISGRSQEIRDVCIDTCGVLFGCILVLVIGKILNLIKTKIKSGKTKTGVIKESRI